MDFSGRCPKSHFNRKEHKVGAKERKVNFQYIRLCELCEKSWRSLRLIFYHFLETLFAFKEKVKEIPVKGPAISFIKMMR
jgi:hypothetical protein